MALGVVPSNPLITSKMVIVPVASRRKPCVPLASLNHPVIAPAALMLRGVVLVEPGGSKVMKDWPNAAIDEVANATPRMEMVKDRKSFRKEGFPREERSGAVTIGIQRFNIVDAPFKIRVVLNVVHFR